MMKKFLLLFTAFLVIASSMVLAQQEGNSKKSFMEKRQEKAIKNMRKNVRATDHFNKSRAERRQRQEEAPKRSMRYLPDQDKNKSKQ